MLRLLAAVIFTVAGGMIGTISSEKLRRSRRRCEAMSYMIHRLSFLIGFRSDDVYSVCSQLRSDTELSPLAFVSSLPTGFVPGEDFRTQWTDAVTAQKDLGKEEMELLLRIGGILGKSDVQGQIAGLGSVQKELDRLTELRTEELYRKSRLYRSAGLLMGAMAGILII